MPATINDDASPFLPGPPTSWNPAIRVLLFLVCLVPFLLLVSAIATNSMGPDPAEHLMHVTGEWVMRFLVLVLLATPLARYGWPRLARYRRMLGLYVWFYATLHLLVFAQVYIGWSGEQLVEELADRPYVPVGFLALAHSSSVGHHIGQGDSEEDGEVLAAASQAHIRRRCLGVAPHTGGCRDRMWVMQYSEPKCLTLVFSGFYFSTASAMLL